MDPSERWSSFRFPKLFMRLRLSLNHSSYNQNLTILAIIITITFALCTIYDIVGIVENEKLTWECLT